MDELLHTLEGLRQEVGYQIDSLIKQRDRLIEELDDVKSELYEIREFLAHRGEQL